MSVAGDTLVKETRGLLPIVVTVKERGCCDFVRWVIWPHVGVTPQQPWLGSGENSVDKEGWSSKYS